MAFVSSPTSELVSKKAIPLYLEQEEAPTAKEIGLAFYRQENIIGSFFSKEAGLPDETKNNPDYDPYGLFTEEEKLDEVFVRTALYADNDEELEAVRRQLSKERQDREIMAQGGATSFIVGLPVAVADPLSMLSVGGVALNTYRAGKGILKGAAVTGSIVGVDTAIQEAALHTQQLTRTYGESAINLSAGMVLGGVLGASVAKLSKLGIDDSFINQMEDALSPEAKVAQGINSTIDEVTPLVSPSSEEIKIFKQKLITEEKAKRIGLAGEKFTRGERKNINKELKDLQQQLKTVEESELTYTKGGKPLKAKSVRHRKQARERKQQDIKAIQEKITTINKTLEKDRKASAAEASISRLEQGILPDSAQKKLDDFIEKQSVVDEILTQPTKIIDAPETGNSVGAAKVYGDVQVSGKFAKKVTKVLGFDPLSRTITSENPQTRLVATLLASNPIKMDGPVLQAAEQLALTHSGKLGNSLQNNANSFKAYKKAGGKIPRKQFNEAVARAIRTGESEVPEIKASADFWRKELYDPLKEEMIAQKLLPEDVDVKTANNYLNRVWNKNKITAQYDVFVSKVSNWLAEKDIELYQSAKVASEKIAKATGKEKEALQKIIDKAEFKKGRDLETDDYEYIAQQIAQRITGTPDGRLPYDWKMGEGSNNNKNFSGTALRGPLRNRTFQIPDELVEEFLENDIEVLGARYLQNTAGDIEITKKFGDVNMVDQLKDIENWYANKLKNKSLTEKQRLKLGKQRDADVRDIAGMRDRIRGVYGFTPDNVWSRIGRSSRDLNYLRLLGGVTVSSLPDVARVFMAEGFAKTFSKGLAPLITNTKAFKIAAAESKRYGVGTDAMMSGKSDIIADVNDYAQGGTILERGLRAGASKFGRLNFLDHWTAGMKQLHAVTMQTSIFDGLSKGKFDKRLARLGIDEQSAKDMWEQVNKYGRKTDGVWLTNAKNWDRPDLERMWGAAVRKESDRVILIPGQEKPLFMSTEMGKSIGQFRSFILSATQRVFIAGLQNQDHNTLGGFTALVGMGMFSYYLKQNIAGRAVSDDPAVWVTEGIDRSGAIGIIGEISNTIEKISSNSLGLRPVLGIDAPASKQVSRTVSESLLGPTFGSLLSTTVAASNAITSDEPMTESDIRTLRRLIPLQNLFYLRHGFNEAEKAVGDL